LVYCAWAGVAVGCCEYSFRTTAWYHGRRVVAD
jgi:hypothetical protein